MSCGTVPGGWWCPLLPTSSTARCEATAQNSAHPASSGVGSALASQGVLAVGEAASAPSRSASRNVCKCRGVRHGGVSIGASLASAWPSVPPDPAAACARAASGLSASARERGRSRVGTGGGWGGGKAPVTHSLTQSPTRSPILKLAHFPPSRPSRPSRSPTSLTSLTH